MPTTDSGNTSTVGSLLAKNAKLRIAERAMQMTHHQKLQQHTLQKSRDYAEIQKQSLQAVVDRQKCECRKDETAEDDAVGEDAGDDSVLIDSGNQVHHHHYQEGGPPRQPTAAQPASQPVSVQQQAQPPQKKSLLRRLGIPVALTLGGLAAGYVANDAIGKFTARQQGQDLEFVPGGLRLVVPEE